MGIDTARAAAIEVEARTLAQPPALPASPAELFLQIRRCLASAFDEEILRTPVHGIFSLLKIDEEQRTDGTAVWVILGGATFDKGQDGSEFFYRRDGARISFVVIVMYANGTLALLAYRFHLQFPAGINPAYVRFDLNPEPSDDALLEPRCHIHAGAEMLRVAAPLMGPVEILDKLLYGMPIP